MISSLENNGIKKMVRSFQIGTIDIAGKFIVCQKGRRKHGCHAERKMSTQDIHCRYDPFQNCSTKGSICGRLCSMTVL